jgi:hypothetical protein
MNVSLRIQNYTGIETRRCKDVVKSPRRTGFTLSGSGTQIHHWTTG